MANTVLYASMISVAVMMAAIPFLIFMGLASLIGEAAFADNRLVWIYFLLLILAAYGLSFGSFTFIQKENCGSVKNWTQIASNAGISTAIQLGTAIGVYFIPFLKNIVLQIFPPDLDMALQDSVSFGYYNFWSALYGIAIGGTLSGICG